jgi:hypothetical protein
MENLKAYILSELADKYGGNQQTMYNWLCSNPQKFIEMKMEV